MTLLAERGFDVSGLTPDLMTSADDVFWFPNIVGPVYPGSALLFRVRPNGRDPELGDQGHVGARVAAPRARSGRCPSGASTPTGTSASGARSPSRTTRTSPTCSAACGHAGSTGPALASKQESNVLHMHRVVDRYLTG